VSTTDTEFYRGFAARVRAQLTTIPVLPAKGAPTMDTTATAETTEAPATPVPATFLPGPGGPCERNAWCADTDEHSHCYGAEIGLPSLWEPKNFDGDTPEVMGAWLMQGPSEAATIVYALANDYEAIFRSGDEMRAETARVRAYLARLDALADQLDAITEAGGAGVPEVAATEPPKTWTFTNFDTGWPVTVTCMAGCDSDHEAHTATPSMLVDVYCVAEGADADVPFAVGSGADEVTQYLQLRPQLTVSPFADSMAERLPHVTVELFDNASIGNLDPDGLTLVTDALQKQVDQLRATHTALVAARAEYLGRAR
jgi:hypothetical protein